MKNKILAVLTAAVVGVMSFTPVMAAQAATLWDDICSNCGELSIIAIQNGSRIEYFDEYGPCQHGYDDHGDRLARHWVRMNYYCRDCDRHWEEWVAHGGPFWSCPYNNME